MPTLRDIRRRITSVRNTQQVTRTMKMVAQARLRRLQGAIGRFRTYSDLLRDVLGQFLLDTVGDEHPLLEPAQGDRTALILMVGDRGLCGPFNGNMLRRAEAFIAEHPGTKLVVVGKKGVAHFAQQDVEIITSFTDVYARATFIDAADIVASVAEPFIDGELDEVHILYSDFVSTMKHDPVLDQLLPLEAAPLRARVPANVLAIPEDRGPGRMDYEPSINAMCGVLLTRWLDVLVYRALLETACSLFSARMMAMDQATDNATEMIDELTLLYNRTRQTNITKELMDIIGGIA